MVQQVPKIFVIDNRENRNERFLPIFTALKDSGQGKLEKNYFLVTSQLYVQQSDSISTVFSSIQSAAMMKGFSYVMYYLNAQ